MLNFILLHKNLISLFLMVSIDFILFLLKIMEIHLPIRLKIIKFKRIINRLGVF